MGIKPFGENISKRMICTFINKIYKFTVTSLFDYFYPE